MRIHTLMPEEKDEVADTNSLFSFSAWHIIEMRLLFISLGDKLNK
jgi:hypothetical protein